MLRDNPAAIIVLAALATGCMMYLSLYAPKLKPIRWPRERWFERLSFWAAMHHIDFPNATAWAFALSNAGEWVHNAFHNHKLIDELNEVHGRLGRLLCEASGGKASKTNYTSETMSSLVQEYQQEAVEEHMVDALARLPNWEFPWARVKVLCQYCEVSEGDVSERRKQIKQMDALMKATRRERERAAAKLRGRVSLGNGLTRKETQAERNERAGREADTAHASGYLASDQH